MDRLVLTLLIIFLSLAAGWMLQRRVAGGKCGLSVEGALRLRLNMQKAAMFGLIPLSAMLSLWGLPAPDSRLLSLPALGVAAWTAGGVLSIVLSRVLGLDGRQTGSMYCCGTFTNIGAVGTLVCVMNLGEQTIAYTALYRLCEEMYYFALACPVARWLGESGGGRLTLQNFRIEPALRLVLLALGLGLVLNLAGVPRPESFGFAASAAMLAGTVCFLLAIGMSLRLSSVREYLPQCAALCLLKFLALPLIMVALAALTGLEGVDGGRPLKVVFILSAMPVAMNALLPPALYGLDEDMANAAWIVTTLALAVVLPVLLLRLPLV